MSRLVGLGVVATLVVAPAALTGQEAADTVPTATGWSLATEGLLYLLPDEADFITAISSADRGSLHLEARYNYEDLWTGSAWAGWHLGWGERLRLDLTPMAGAVVGRTKGVAPGVEITLSAGKLELYSEAEYVLDLEDRGSSFLYSWSELSFAPAGWMWVGLVAQRTRVYSTDLDLQRGLFLGVHRGPLSLTTYLFNLGWDDPFDVVGLSVEF